MHTQKTFNTQRGTRRYFGKDLTNLEEENPRTFAGRNERVSDHDSANLAKKNGASSLSSHQVAGNSQSRYKLGYSDAVGKKPQSNQNSTVVQNQSLSTSVSKNSQSQTFTKPAQGQNVGLSTEQQSRSSLIGYSGVPVSGAKDYSQNMGQEVQGNFEEYSNLGYCPSPAHVPNQKGPIQNLGQSLHTRNSSGINRGSLGSSNNLTSGTPNQQFSWTPVVHQAHHDHLQAAAHKPGAGASMWEQTEEMSVERAEYAWRRKMMQEGFEPAPERIAEHTQLSYGYKAPNLRLARNSSQISIENTSQHSNHMMQEEVIPARYGHRRSVSPMHTEVLQQQSPIWEEPQQQIPEVNPRHLGYGQQMREAVQIPGAEFIDFNGIPFSKIWYNLLAAKHANACSTAYLVQHRDINEDMRDIVIDWLVDVHRKFKMKTETLFHALSLMDRYLERNEIKKEIFQLVATTCLFIASKFEEIYPPVLEDFVYICADTYTKNEIIHMEALILNDVGFRLVTSTSHTLLGIYATQSRLACNFRGFDQKAV